MQKISFLLLKTLKNTTSAQLWTRHALKERKMTNSWKIYKQTAENNKS